MKNKIDKMTGIFMKLILAAALIYLAEIASADTVPAPTQNDRIGINAAKKTPAEFTITSPEVKNDGMLPKEFTGDGSAATLPLEWSGAPAETKSYAVIMHHIDPKGIAKWYWTLYNIPSTTRSLPKNVKNLGTLGNNSVNGKPEYAPPHSKGPGPKTYIYTVYALSEAPQIKVPPEQVSRDVLLEAMKNKILASAELSVVYSRPEGSTNQNDKNNEKRVQPGEYNHGAPPPRNEQNKK